MDWAKTTKKAKIKGLENLVLYGITVTLGTTLSGYYTEVAYL